MKIVCTINEFEKILSACPVHNTLLPNGLRNDYLESCENACVLKEFCIFIKDDEVGFNGDMFEIIKAGGQNEID